ncbi:MAG: hypothetical protein CMA65_05600 [Euryarchaeota archaeon]|nr:hypothetical protein [Euryarchaeota archaeon]
MSERTLPFLLVSLLLITSMAPLTMADDGARSSPDFVVTSFTLDDAGSILDGGSVVAEAATHIVRIQVKNNGLAAGQASLSLLHQGTATSGDSVVDTTDLGIIASGASSNVVVFSWAATLGPDQILKARVSSATDVNTANNEEQLLVDVTLTQAASVPSIIDIPQPADPMTQNSVVWSKSVHDYSINVRNDGVKNFSASYKLEFTNVATPATTFTETSATVPIVRPGSLYNGGATPSIVSLNFDATSLTGEWSVVGTMTAAGTGWSDDVEFLNFNVVFSNFNAEVTPAQDRSIQPGQSTTLTYLIKNTGLSSDDFSVGVSSVSGWANVAGTVSTTATISPGVTTSVLVQVDVPANAARTASDTVTVTLTSSGSSFVYTATTTILAGESYDVTVNMPATTQQLTPGVPSTILVDVTNDGNAASTFMLNAGLTSTATGWDLQFTNSLTGMLAPGATVSVSLEITPPTIKSPLVSSENNRAGDAMSVWVQAQSVLGGLPGFDSTPMEILPVVIVDPGLPVEAIEMTVEQVFAARAGNGLEEILDLDVEVRHNLVSDLSETVDATLSLGTPVFTSDSSGGFDEASRWAIGLNPTSFPTMELGDTELAKFTLQGPADDYPVSGVLTIPITATPTLGGVHMGSNVIPTAVTQTLRVNVPPVLGADVYDGEPLDAVVGEMTQFNLSLGNSGNNMTSYRLVMEDTLPDNWVASFSNTTSLVSTTLLTVPANVADYPTIGDLHISDYIVVVTTDPLAPAQSIEYLKIRVEQVDTGVFITEFDLPIEVGEKVNAALSPATQEVNLSLGESLSTRITVNNVGNTPAEFSVWLDDSQAGEITYTMETSPTLLIGAGYADTIKIRLTPSVDARADEEYQATVWVSNLQSGLNVSAVIEGNMSEEHGMAISTVESVGVIPGTVQNVAYSITNNGNLAEDVIIETKVGGDWTLTPANFSLELEIDELYDGAMDITVPSLGGDDSLTNGSLYPVTIRVLKPDTFEELASHSFNLIISPLFMVEAEDWPTEMKYHATFGRTWNVDLTNTGNSDVTVNLTYTLLKGGLATPTTDWVLVNPSPDSLFLPRGEPVTLTFTIEATKPDPDLTLAANLAVKLTPTDTSVEGSAEFFTNLKMERFFELSDTQVDYGKGTSIMYDITYSHIPNGPGTPVAYEVELCQAVRLLDFTALDEDATLQPWAFAIVVDDTEYPLDLTQECPTQGSLGAESRITLPTRSAYVTDSPIRLKVTPPTGEVLPGDGWDLTMRLYHPNENTGYTFFDDATLTYSLAVYANPKVMEHGPVGGNLYEGVETAYSATIKNTGTAKALGITATLDCGDDITIVSPANGQIGILELKAQESKVVEWTVIGETINWWEVSKGVSCSVELDIVHAGDANDLKDDLLTEPIDVKSQSPGLSIVFVACIVAALVSFVFTRLATQSEKWQLGGVYAGVLSFGFAFHLGFGFEVGGVAIWGPVVLVLNALWVWRMTWKSSEEFRLIHEDYQRARKGISTVYSDHFEALSDGRRQLTIILSLPVLGMLAIVLGLPPQLTTDSRNLVVMASYFLIIMIGVWYFLKRSDKLYGNLYGRLTDAEIKSIRIERDLGDPARLLNDLANDGLDLSSLLGTSSNSDVVEEEPEPPKAIDVSSITGEKEVEPDV